MKELTRKEVQQLSLEILKDIHRFCIENDIHYSIAYGSMIGAVRHKGFIPWDDDVDILMMREDYEKFAKLYKSDQFEFINFENCQDCWTLFGRVCDTVKTTHRSSTPWLSEHKDSGVWIDVFPIDETSDDIKVHQKTYGLLKHLYLYSAQLRKVHCFIPKDMPLALKLKAWHMTKFNPQLKKHSPREHLGYMKMLIEKMQGCAYKHYSQMCDAEVPGEYYTEEELGGYVELPFEDMKVMAFRGYDSMLRKVYGDYMQIPPKKVQKRSFRTFLRFYWKNS